MSYTAIDKYLTDEWLNNCKRIGPWLAGVHKRLQGAPPFVHEAFATQTPVYTTRAAPSRRLFVHDGTASGHSTQLNRPLLKTRSALCWWVLWILKAKCRAKARKS